MRKTIEPFAARAGRYAPIGVVVLLAALLIGLLGAANAETARSNLELQAQIAAREEAERALRQAQKMEALGQLTGGVAHDFNNILMAGLSGLELMGRAQTDQRREALATAIRDTLKRCASLTQQLLTFARRTPVETEAVDIGEHLTSLGPMLRHSLRDGVMLAIDVPADIWPIETDLSQFDIALLNLTVNARDAMPEGGEMRLSARNRAQTLNGADAVEISLEDEGTGMSSEALEKAFEPFFTTKERGRGTGLGLAQVYGFASASGGEVKLESRPGEGTRVTLLLKRAALGLARAGGAARGNSALECRAIEFEVRSAPEP